MGEAIDTAELLKEAYILEVSSPGISEDISSDKDFQTFKGFPIEILFRDKKNAEISRCGLLKERSKEHIHLNIKGRISLIPRDDVIHVRLTNQTG